MVDADDVRRRELIVLRERLPSVTPIEKFVGEPEFQLGMISQIVDRPDTFLFRGGSSHDQRIGVVESEFAGHADAELCELFSHLANAGRRRLQNFFRDCPGVFRINRDLVILQCLPKNDGAAHALAVLGR